jgi:hypothetical protein
VPDFFHSRFEATTQSIDGGAPSVILFANFEAPGMPVAIRLRHPVSGEWCAAGARWTRQVGAAVKFASNIDALLFCEVLRVPAQIVAHDAQGREVYTLEVDKILSAVLGKESLPIARTARTA